MYKVENMAWYNRVLCWLGTHKEWRHFIYKKYKVSTCVRCGIHSANFDICAIEHVPGFSKDDPARDVDGFVPIACKPLFELPSEIACDEVDEYIQALKNLKYSDRAKRKHHRKVRNNCKYFKHKKT